MKFLHSYIPHIATITLFVFCTATHAAEQNKELVTNKNAIYYLWNGVKSSTSTVYNTLYALTHAAKTHEHIKEMHEVSSLALERITRLEKENKALKSFIEQEKLDRTATIENLRNACTTNLEISAANLKATTECTLMNAMNEQLATIKKYQETQESTFNRISGIMVGMDSQKHDFEELQKAHQGTQAGLKQLALATIEQLKQIEMFNTEVKKIGTRVILIGDSVKNETASRINANKQIEQSLNNNITRLESLMAQPRKQRELVLKSSK